MDIHNIHGYDQNHDLHGYPYSRQACQIGPTNHDIQALRALPIARAYVPVSLTGKMLNGVKQLSLKYIYYLLGIIMRLNLGKLSSSG